MSNFAITTLCTIAGIALTALFSYAAHQRAVKQDSQTDGENKGVMLSDIGYIKAGIDDLKREQRDMRLSINEISERIARVEESVKQAHKRINGLESKMNT